MHRVLYFLIYFFIFLRSYSIIFYASKLDFLFLISRIFLILSISQNSKFIFIYFSTVFYGRLITFIWAEIPSLSLKKIEKRDPCETDSNRFRSLFWDLISLSEFLKHVILKIMFGLQF